MDWLRVLLLLFKIIDAVVSALHDRGIIESTLATALQEHNASAKKEIVDAQAIRDAVSTAPVERLRDDDGFRGD